MLLITNANILTPDKIIHNAALCIDGNTIAEIGPIPDLEKKYPSAKRINAKGGLVMPGLTNCHMHFYSTFARGMLLAGTPPTTFTEILEGLWWRLDKVLTADDVFYSALVPLIECVRSGTTCVIDHHASPNFVLGSLNKIKEALSQIPVRASLCYEVSDRDGKDIAAQGIDENTQFIKDHAGNNMLKGLFGLHASFTLSDKTLEQCAQAVNNLKTGIHVHTAEGVADADHCRQNHGCGVVERWRQFNLLGPRAILAHCIHIDHKEMQIIKETGTNVVHNPESNMNNAVGSADILKMLALGINVGLGTDGITSDMFQEAKFAHLKRKHVAHDPRVGFAETTKLLFENNYKILANLFKGTLGTITKGAFADLIILDYQPPTPFNRQNFAGHFLYAMNSNLVATTIVDGKVLMHDREIIGIDVERVMAVSRGLAQKMWGRI
ncbi:MAG: putative aminohydrolase SsnA [Deltaproteobacteria bacterium]|nr:putative aminohydrolase SsnA [Deltaproteobacteria bacterium]